VSEHQTMIIAKMALADAPKVADVFARSDATSMPYDIGVTRRQLFTFHDLYVHLIDFDRPQSESMAVAQTLPAFRSISEELRPYIIPYDPNWKSPQDAMPRRFYDWSAERS
jgi:cyclase